MSRAIIFFALTVFLAGAATAVLTAPLRMDAAGTRAASRSLGLAEEAQAILSGYRHQLYRVETEDADGKPYRLPWILTNDGCATALTFLAKHGQGGTCEPVAD